MIYSCDRLHTVYIRILYVYDVCMRILLLGGISHTHNKFHACMYVRVWKCSVHMIVRLVTRVLNVISHTHIGEKLKRPRPLQLLRPWYGTHTKRVPQTYRRLGGVHVHASTRAYMCAHTHTNAKCKFSCCHYVVTRTWQSQDACALSRHCEPVQANSWSRARNSQED